MKMEIVSKHSLAICTGSKILRNNSRDYHKAKCKIDRSRKRKYEQEPSFRNSENPIKRSRSEDLEVVEMMVIDEPQNELGKRL